MEGWRLLDTGAVHAALIRTVIGGLVLCSGAALSGCAAAPTGAKQGKPAPASPHLTEQLMLQMADLEMAKTRTPEGSEVQWGTTPAGVPAGNALVSPAATTTAAVLPPAGAVVAAPQPTSYALVIGISEYRDIPGAPGAAADAQAFAQVLSKTYSISPSKMKVLVNERATRTDINKQLRWIHDVAPAGSRIYFFFSGHGSPNTSTGSPYLVPHDGDPSYLEESGVKLDDALARLSSSKAKEVFAFTDACYSGAGGRSVLPKGARPLTKVAAPKSKAKVTLLSASSGSEISGPDASGTKGLFTSYLVEALSTGRADMDGDGQISLNELHTWVKPRVSRDAQNQGRAQNPGMQRKKSKTNADHVIVGWGYASQ